MLEAALKAHYAGVRARLINPRQVATRRIALPAPVPKLPPLVPSAFGAPVDFLRPAGCRFIQELVAASVGLTVEELIGRSQFAKFVKPRHLAMRIAATHTEFSSPVLGKAFGGRHHTTILAALGRTSKPRKVKATLTTEVSNASHG